MANIFPAMARIHPSYIEPGLIITYAQPSGAWELLERSAPRVKIGTGDLAVYIKTLDLRTEARGAQSAANFLPSATLVADYHSTATYLLRVRAIYDRHDMNAAGNWDVSLPQAQELAMRQGIFQAARVGLLYGFNPSNGEGLLNTQGATAVTLPPDSLGNTTVSTYENGDMALFILQQIVNIKMKMYNTGPGISNRIVIVGPQREFVQFSYVDIVQVTSYQRPGSGTATVGEIIKTLAEENGDQVEWYFDDTLIGKGAGGTDMIIITIPELTVPKRPGINTNIFGEVNPAITACNLQYSDMAAPITITTPTPDGAVVQLAEQRFSSGWCIRPQALALVSMPY